MSIAPAIVVVIPYYQQDEFLAEAVRSVKAQTYANVEIVVVDDCSPGLPAARILEAAGLSGVKVLRHEENRGLGAARNTGISASSAELIVSLDADDLIAPDYLEVTAALMAKGDYAVVSTSVRQFGEADATWTPVLRLPEILMRGAPSTFLFRRSVFDGVGGYNEALRHSPDKAFLISILRAGHEIGLVDRPLYLYRKHSEQFSAREDAAEEFVRATFGTHSDLYEQHLLEVVTTGARGLWDSASVLRKARTQLEKLHRLRSTYDDLAAQYSAAGA
ncbi:MAG TPA: glycosyltransferase family 2 protein [Candidatus Obscuribacterales bacterium]